MAKIAKMMKNKYKDIALLSLVVMAIQVVLSKWIYPLFDTATQELFSITPQTALTSTTVGSKILGTLSGIVPFDLGSFNTLLAMFISVFVLLSIGFFVYNQKWAWKGKNKYQRMWAILLYGTLALWLILVLFGGSALSGVAVPVLVGLGINYAVIGFVVVQLAKRYPNLRV